MLSNTAFFALLVEPGALARSKLNFTSLASKASPSWNFTPLLQLEGVDLAVGIDRPALGQERRDPAVHVDLGQALEHAQVHDLADRRRRRRRSGRDRAPARAPCRGRRCPCASARRRRRRARRRGGRSRSTGAMTTARRDGRGGESKRRPWIGSGREGDGRLYGNVARVAARAGTTSARRPRRSARPSRPGTRRGRRAPRPGAAARRGRPCRACRPACGAGRSSGACRRAARTRRRRRSCSGATSEPTLPGRRSSVPAPIGRSASITGASRLPRPRRPARRCRAAGRGRSRSRSPRPGSRSESFTEAKYAALPRVPFSSFIQATTRTVRRGTRPSDFSSATAPIDAVTPMPSSIAPVPRSQLSRWPETSTTCSGDLAARQVGDDVVAVGVGQRLRRQGELHRQRAARGQSLDQERVLDRDGRRRDRRRAGRPVGRAGVRDAVVRAADRAHQRRGGAELREQRRRAKARLAALAVGVAGQAVVGERLVEGHADEDDPALRPRPRAIDLGASSPAPAPARSGRRRASRPSRRAR